MAEHYWVFPWFAIIAGVFTALAGTGVGGALRGRPRPRWPVSLIVVWLAASAGLFLASLHLGALSGVDYIAARGFLLGMAAGFGLSWLAQVAPARLNALAPVMIGLCVAVVAAGRLWLTHGEMSGLTALALAATETILCLSVAPALIDSSLLEADQWQVCRRAGAGLLFLVSLDIAVQLGFTKADVLKTMFWADIPLLLGAALALGALVGNALWRGEKARPVLPILCALAAGALAAVPLSLKVASGWEVAILPLLGAALFALFPGLVGGERSAEQAEASSHGILAGLLLLVAGATISFALWAGYGLALLAIGGWFTGGLVLFRQESAGARRTGAALLGAFGLAALLLAYRLALLQGGEVMRSRGPGDIWDLFAICLGALIPWMVAEWSVSLAQGRAASGSLTALQWLLAAIIPALVLEYIWRPRALAGVFLGVALGQILASASASRMQRAAASAVTGLLFSLVILAFLPWFTEAASPTRIVRLTLVAGLAVLIVLRALVPSRRAQPIAPTAQEG